MHNWYYIYNSTFCGNIEKSFFSSTLEHYTESLVYNTCLNKKIAINKSGEIKNCPSMKKSYGNIKTTTLTKVLNNKNFTRYWSINKDQIEVLKTVSLGIFAPIVELIKKTRIMTILNH